MDSPLRAILCEPCTMWSRMASASVGSSSHACHAVTGNWLVISVERLPTRSSNNSSKSLRSCAAMGAMAKSSSINRSNRLA